MNEAPLASTSGRLLPSSRPAWLGAFGLIALYALAHALLLVDRGVYWDDWTLYHMPPSVIVANNTAAGSYFFGVFHAYLAASSAAIALYNVLTFGCYLASGLLIWRLLRRSSLLTESEAWAIAALMLVLPLNLARNAMINGQYAVCHLLFWLGFAVYQANWERSRPVPVLVILAAVLFMVSFLTNSLLVYFVLVPLYGIWQQRPATLTAAVQAAVRVVPWLVLPVLFWGLRSRFLQPTGDYAVTHYNEITAANLLGLPLELGRTFYFSLVKILVSALLALRSGVVAGLAIIGTAGVLSLTRSAWFPVDISAAATLNWRRELVGCMAGAILFALGAFPYLAVGLLPTQVEWSSRHQLLLPLGAAVLLYFGLRLMANALPASTRAWTIGVGIAGLLMVFVADDVRTYIAYERDWLKQVSLMHQLYAAPAVRANTTFVIEDETRNLNVFERGVRFYEYGGQLKLLFGHDNRFAAPAEIYTSLAETLPNGLGDLAGGAQHNLGEYRVSIPRVRLRITPGVPLSDFAVLKHTLIGGAADNPGAPIVRLLAEPLPAAEAAQLPLQ